MVPESTAKPDIKLSIVMPAFNEAVTIRRAVLSVLQSIYPCPIELIVVDDGSTDGTSQKISDIRDARLRIIRHESNFGKGAALRTGIRVASGTHFVPFDADLEYSAMELADLLAPIIAGRTDVVYGARLFGSNTVYQSFLYAIGNRATTFIANLLFDSYISDLHTCLKLIPLHVVRGLQLTEVGFGLDTELTASVLKLGHRPFEVPISYVSRTHAQGKKITWRDGIECLRILGRVRISSRYGKQDRQGAMQGLLTPPLVDLHVEPLSVEVIALESVPTDIQTRLA